MQSFEPWSIDYSSAVLNKHISEAIALLYIKQCIKSAANKSNKLKRPLPYKLSDSEEAKVNEIKNPDIALPNKIKILYDAANKNQADMPALMSDIKKTFFHNATDAFAETKSWLHYSAHDFLYGLELPGQKVYHIQKVAPKSIVTPYAGDFVFDNNGNLEKHLRKVPILLALFAGTIAFLLTRHPAFTAAAATGAWLIARASIKKKTAESNEIAYRLFPIKIYDHLDGILQSNVKRYVEEVNYHLNEKVKTK